MAADSVHFAPLGELVDLQTEQINPGAQPDVAFEHYSIPAYDAGARAVIELGSDIKSNKFVIPDGSILLSKLNPRINRVWTPRVSGVRPAVASTEFLVLTPKPGVDRRFLHFLFQSPIFRAELTSRVTGTSGSHQRVRPQDALNIPVTVPSLARQQSISSVLGRLDDKIELNRRRSETLEEVVREVHRAWFVDPGGQVSVGRFDRPSLSTWSPGRLGDLAAEKRQGVHPETVAPDTPYIGLEHMPRRRTTLDAWGYAEGLGSNKYHFGRGDILFGKLRPYFHKVGVAPVSGICSTDIVVVTPKDETYFGFLLGVLSSDEFVQFTDSASTGTRMPRTSWKTMSTYEVRVPPPQVARVFNDLVRPIVARTINATLESKTLSELRNTLLPKLISGEIRVPEAEQLVSEVA